MGEKWKKKKEAKAHLALMATESVDSVCGAFKAGVGGDPAHCFYHGPVNT